MKNSRLSARLLALIVCVTINVAHGTVFNFSYLFGDGLKASGSLTGTQNGLFVDNVSNVSLFLNGTPAPGSIFASKFDLSTFSYLNGPIVSFDAAQNNFVLSNSNFVSGDFSADSFFLVLNSSVSPYGGATAIAQAIPLNDFGSQDFPTVVRNWTLTAAVASVPDGSATITLLGMAMFGLVCARRKR